MTQSFVGTTEYLAPEVIMEDSYGFSVDWYSLGLVMFELITGYNPFKTGDKATHIQKMNMIVNADIKMPSSFTPECADLCKRLLVKDVSSPLINFLADQTYWLWLDGSE
jgi:serine/threonine protein kinase